MDSRLTRLMALMLASAVGVWAAEPAATPGPAPAPGGYPLEAYSVIGSSFAQNRRLADLSPYRSMWS